ncbi:MAG: DUF5810 domain-containing protein [Haloferacaceae archaeon]
MGYACPVCDLPQHDAEHLANHLAMTALTHGDDHEAWLDDHAAGWSEESPETLGDRVVSHAEEVPHETVFEDTTGEGAHDHGSGGVDTPAGAAPAPDTEAAQAAVEAARRMAAEQAEDDETESAEDGS